LVKPGVNGRLDRDPTAKKLYRQGRESCDIVTIDAARENKMGKIVDAISCK